MVDAPRDGALQAFPRTVAIDTCSVWNILSSKTLTLAARQSCHFVLAEYVRYECLVKVWNVSSKSPADRTALQAKLSEALAAGKHFSVQPLSVDDLRGLVADVQTVRRFDRGELAALALARKLYSGFMTDDRIARRVGEEALGLDRVRTTPHLVGHLVYVGQLSDGDIQAVIKDNVALNTRYGNLEEYIKKCYEHAMGLRLRERVA